MLPKLVTETLCLQLMSTVSSISKKILDEIEAARGSRYSQAYGYKKLEQIKTLLLDAALFRANRTWQSASDSIHLPTQPMELDQYNKRMTNYDVAIFRHKFSYEDVPPPAKPNAVTKYEEEILNFLVDLSAWANKIGEAWDRVFLESVGQQFLLEQRIKQAPKPPARSRFSGKTMKPYSPLLGDQMPFEGGDYLSKDQAREAFRRYQSSIGRDLILVEDLSINGQPREVFERESESSTHEHLVSDMICILQRQGYKIYPGGVGLSGLYTMADLFAVAPNDAIFFVECLTKGSINLGGHIKKRNLAIHAPMVFVGHLPPEFVSTLPETSTCIEYPRASKTLSGEWTPAFYRTSEYKGFVFRFSKLPSRKMERYEITLPGLLLPEDVSGFLLSALSNALHSKNSNGMRQIETLRERIGDLKLKEPSSRRDSIPFERYGKSESVFELELKDSKLNIRFGRYPPIAEVRGTKESLQLIETLLNKVGANLDFK